MMLRRNSNDDDYSKLAEQLLDPAWLSLNANLLCPFCGDNNIVGCKSNGAIWSWWKIFLPLAKKLPSLAKCRIEKDCRLFNDVACTRPVE
jgi:hypothetical protein